MGYTGSTVKLSHEVSTHFFINTMPLSALSTDPLSRSWLGSHALEAKRIQICRYGVYGDGQVERNDCKTQICDAAEAVSACASRTKTKDGGKESLVSTVGGETSPFPQVTARGALGQARLGT